MSNKLQSLLITQLQKYGSVKLLLPDNVTLEIGVNQIDDESGRLVNVEDYCWVIASRRDRMAVLDSYNLGLRFSDDDKCIVLEDRTVGSSGETLRRLDVV